MIVPAYSKVDPLLTIVVPTYNRAPQLQSLLNELGVQVPACRGAVQVIISNNASTDGTREVVADFVRLLPEALILHQEQNVGPDENFCRCVERVGTKNFWMIGDDDIPASGAIGRVVDVLRGEAPDLLYLNSMPLDARVGDSSGKVSGDLPVASLDQLEFARKVHVFFTFISGMVVNRDLLLRSLGSNGIRRFQGTNLVQLGWVYPVLLAGSRFACISRPCIFATQDNSGGYAVLTVFAVKFPRITREMFRDRADLADAIISRTARMFLPRLIRLSRRRWAGRFVQEDPWPDVTAELRRSPYFWLFMVPIGKSPAWLAEVVYQLWRVTNRALSLLER